MRKFIPLAFALLLAAAPAFAAQPVLFPSLGHKLTDQDKADLDRVSAYLNSIKTMQGAFIQIGPNGQADQGKFYIAKPGRMRFEYAPPNPVLLVSDGSTVFVRNSQLNTTDHYPLSQTPLELILSNTIDLKKRAEIVGIDRGPGTLTVSARSNSSRAQGNITLVFATPTLELRQWTVLDAQGLSTTVALRNVQLGADMPASTFTLASRKP
ncbi:MAG TPA: outer membrane lipoprotein carrier protein LolA [Rhizomicrobium sp.]|jgi:outer membrane lipoprotein-sorting protein|nr:outer membrane lipoprotein carrier protein LolA [Rhizomicrobium sp.]